MTYYTIYFIANLMTLRNSRSNGPSTLLCGILIEATRLPTGSRIASMPAKVAKFIRSLMHLHIKIIRITYGEFITPDGEPLDRTERLALGQGEGDICPPVGLQDFRGAALVPQPLSAHVTRGLAVAHVEVGGWKKNTQHY